MFHSLFFDLVNRRLIKLLLRSLRADCRARGQRDQGRQQNSSVSFQHFFLRVRSRPGSAGIPACLTAVLEEAGGGPALPGPYTKPPSKRLLFCCSRARPFWLEQQSFGGVVFNLIAAE